MLHLYGVLALHGLVNHIPFAPTFLTSLIFLSLWAECRWRIVGQQDRKIWLLVLVGNLISLFFWRDVSVTTIAHCIAWDISVLLI